MNPEQHHPPKTRAPSKIVTTAQERMAAITRKQVRTQGAVIMAVYFVTLAWLQVPAIPVMVDGFVVWVLLAFLLASLVVLSRRSARTLATEYQKAIQDLEQEVHDISFRERTATIMDKTTGVYSYEYLHERLGEEVDRARRYGRPVTLIVVDLAQFHRVNQRYGRGTGNQVLRRFALNIVRPAVRSTDVVARYGGDEFAILLPETDFLQAEPVVRRIAEAAARGTILTDGQRLTLPITSGIATYPTDGTTVQELVQTVERALLQAKTAGSVLDRMPGKV